MLNVTEKQEREERVHTHNVWNILDIFINKNKKVLTEIK